MSCSPTANVPLAGAQVAVAVAVIARYLAAASADTRLKMLTHMLASSRRAFARSAVWPCTLCSSARRTPCFALAPGMLRAARNLLIAVRAGAGAASFLPSALPPAGGGRGGLRWPHRRRLVLRAVCSAAHV